MILSSSSGSSWEDWQGLLVGASCALLTYSCDGISGSYVCVLVSKSSMLQSCRMALFNLNLPCLFGLQDSWLPYGLFILPLFSFLKLNINYPLMYDHSFLSLHSFQLPPHLSSPLDPLSLCFLYRKEQAFKTDNRNKTRHSKTIKELLFWNWTRKPNGRKKVPWTEPAFLPTTSSLQSSHLPPCSYLTTNTRLYFHFPYVLLSSLYESMLSTPCHLSTFLASMSSSP